MFHYVCWQQAGILGEPLVSYFLYSVLQLLLQTNSFLALVYWQRIWKDKLQWTITALCWVIARRPHFPLKSVITVFSLPIFPAVPLNFPGFCLIENWPFSKLSTVFFQKNMNWYPPTIVEMVDCKELWNHQFLCILLHRQIPFFIRSNGIQQDA